MQRSYGCIALQLPKRCIVRTQESCASQPRNWATHGRKMRCMRELCYVASRDAMWAPKYHVVSVKILVAHPGSVSCRLAIHCAPTGNTLCTHNIGVALCTNKALRSQKSATLLAQELRCTCTRLCCARELHYAHPWDAWHAPKSLWCVCKSWVSRVQIDVLHEHKGRTACSSRA